MCKRSAGVVKWHYKLLLTHPVAEAYGGDKADNVQRSGEHRACLVINACFNRLRPAPAMADPPELWLWEYPPRIAVELVLFLLLPTTSSLEPWRPCPIIATSTKK